MSQPLSVYLDAMTRYASAMDDLSTGFQDTRRMLTDADVTSDSFGMLPDSRKVATVYEQRTTDGLDVLNTGVDVFSGLAQVMRQLRDGYGGTDQASADQLRDPS